MGNYLDCDTAPPNVGGCTVNKSNDVNNCTACGAKCDTTTGTPTCNGSRCTYACNGGQADCNTGGLDTNGCECQTSTTPPDGGCCSTGCQTAHNNCAGGTCTGLGQSYFDCTGTGIYNETQAFKACVAHTGDISKCQHFICVTGGSAKETDDDVVCDNNGCAGGPSTCTCNCWDYPNPTGGQPGGGPNGIGHVNQNCNCANTNVDPSWN
jgi:hypothetical protein